MKAFRIIKISTSLILVLCIFLPLSQCKGQVTEHQDGADIYRNIYLYDNLFESDTNLEGVMRVATWVMPLLLLAFGLRFGVSIKLLVVQLVALGFAGFSWVGAVFWSDKLLWPAYLSALCLLTLFCIVMVEVFVAVRSLRLKKLAT